jgi:hypothetical protein
VQTLVASAVLKGRSTPLYWASCEGHTYDGQRSRNAFEESLLLVLRSMVPATVKVILLADRGFGRTALAGFCRRPPPPPKPSPPSWNSTKPWRKSGDDLG